MSSIELESVIGTPSKFKEWGKKVEKNFEGYLAMVLLLTYTSIVIYDIISRFLFNEQLLWGLTTTLGLFSWVCWLSASLAIRSQSHFRFTLVRQKVSDRANYLLRWIDTILWIAIIGVVVYFSIEVLMSRASSGVTITGTSFPRYLMYASVPVGGSLMIIRAIQQIINVSRKYKRGEDIAPDSSI